MNSPLLPVSSREFNRQSVQEAIKKIQGKLGSFKVLPSNGLVIFCGQPDETKLILLALEPIKPIAQTLYLCDNRFHTEILRPQLTIGDSKIGFVVIDGHSTSFHLLNGNMRETLFKLEVSLPKKHGRGGQSQNRFARIRDEKRGWYISKVVEYFTHYFMENGLLKVTSLIFAGCAGFKHELAKKLDPRVNEKILAFVDVQYGGENGFHQAIELSSNILKNTKFVEEQKILQSFFDQIVIDGAYCYSSTLSINSLEQGLIEKLIVWDELPDIRYELVSLSDPTIKKIVFKSPSSFQDYNEKVIEPVSFPGFEIISSMPLLDWILEHYKEFGSKIELVSNSSSIGNQFIKGFGGIGGFLRFKLDHNVNEEELNHDSDDLSNDEESEYDYEYDYEY